MRRPSFAYSVVRDMKKKWPHEILGASHVAIFFAVFFHITHDGLSERGSACSLMGM